MSEMKSPEIVRVNGKEAELFRDGAPPVYLLRDGRFAFQINKEQWIVRASMKAIENEIAKKRKFLKIMRVSDTYGGGSSIYTREGEAIAMTDTQYTDRQGTKHTKTYSLYVFDAAIVKELEELESRRLKYEKEISKARDAIMRKAQRVHSGNFPAILEQHGEDK